MTRAIRDIAILAHIDAGKTTLTEQLLYLTGSIGYAGSVEDGSTVTDWQLQEQQRGITIGSAAVTCRYRDTEITIVDTPGHVDFTIEVARSLRVIDGAVVVLSAVDGVQAQTETVWHQARERGLPAIGFVNRLDRPGFEDEALEEDIRGRLGITPLPLQVPVEHGEGRVAVLDLLSGQVRQWDQTDTKQPARRGEVRAPNEEEAALRQIYLEALVDVVSASDDALAEVVLSGGEPTRAQYLAAIRRATIDGRCLPLLYGAARTGAGLWGVADAIVDFLPAPDEGPKPRLYDVSSGRLAESGANPDAQGTAAFVFKTETRRGRLQTPSRLIYLRVFGGAIEAGARLERLPAGEPFRPTELVRLMGASYEPVERLERGDIGGVMAGVDEEVPVTGETLAEPGFPWAFERIDPPRPVIAVALEASDIEDDGRMRTAMREIVADDPSLAVAVDPATGQTLLSGMGELQLELAIERLAEQLQAPLSVGRPRARRRRVLLTAGGGRGLWQALDGTIARVEIAAEVRAVSGQRANTWRFSTEAQIPRRAECREALEAGIEAGLSDPEALDEDVIGAQVQISAVEVRGEPPPVAYRNAARDAVAAAVEAAGHQRAEPWMKLSIVVPDEAVGRVVGDLSRRRAHVRRSESRGAMQVLSVDGPLADLIGYATDLRSITSGRGIFTMEPAGYQPSED